MNFKRVCKSALCLLVACFLVFNIVSIPARATGVGATAAINAAGTVLSPVGMILCATFVALGLAAAANPEGFQNMVDAGVSALESAGIWVKDGMVELLRTEDADGNASYYVPGDLLSAVNSMECFNNVREAVYVGAVATGYPYTCMGVTYTFTAPVQVYQTYSGSSGNYFYINLFYSSVPFSCYKNKGTTTSQSSSSQYGNAYICQQQSSSFATAPVGVPQYEYYSARDYCSQNVLPADSSLFDSLTGIDVGELAPAATDFTDGTSARQWSEAYASHALMVNPSPDSGDDYKLYYPLVLPPSLSDLYSSTQADQWSGAASPGFTDYEEKEDYLIHDLPVVDGYQGVVVSPADKETDTESGTQSGTTTGAVTLPGWLSEGISNLLQGLKDILSGILALPAAIAKAIWDALPAWIQEGILNMIAGLSNILDAIVALPAAIAEALAAVFIPSADYITSKVDALRGEFGFIDSVIATGEFIRDSVSGASGPPAIYVNLGNAPSGNYGSQRVLLTDFSWYAPYKSQVDTVLSAALWAFFGWRVFLKLPGIIGGESGYISEVFFTSSSSRSGSDDKKKGGK